MQLFARCSGRAVADVGAEWHCYLTPTYGNTTGKAYGTGNSVYWTQNTQINGGASITNNCAYTLYDRWSDSARAWIIEGFNKPNLMCE